MLGAAWVELIKRIPATYHDSLVAVTSTGAEIMVQRIMRLEEDFVIMRGRPAGSTEPGRVLLLPWDQLNHVAFHKSLPEPEIQRIFGDDAAATVVSEPVPEKKAESSVAQQPAEEPAAEPEAPAASAEPAAKVPVAPPAKPAPVSKSILLARLRARMANEVAKG